MNPDEGLGDKNGYKPERPDPPTDLALIVERWPTLPDAIRAGILAIVRNVAGNQSR